MQMLTERNSSGGTIDYPRGGTGTIVGALIRGLHKHRGRILLRAHVDEIIMEGRRLLHSVCLPSYSVCCIANLADLRRHIHSADGHGGEDARLVARSLQTEPDGCCLQPAPSLA